MQEHISRKFPLSSSSFSNKQLHFLQADLFGAGTDTSLTTIKWCVAALAKNPDTVQEELRREMGTVLGEGTQEVKLEDVERLPKMKVTETAGFGYKKL